MSKPVGSVDFGQGICLGLVGALTALFAATPPTCRLGSESTRPRAHSPLSIQTQAQLFDLASSSLALNCPNIWPKGSEPLREVLIYYCNETAPDVAEWKNYETILEWLDSQGGDLNRAIAQGLRQDATQFQLAVDRELAAIASAGSSQSLSLLIATNRMAREGKCLVRDSSRGPSTFEVALKVAPSENLVIKSNPLSQVDSLQQVLSTAAEIFDPSRHEFLLIIKSHGSERMAVTVKLPRVASELNRDEFLKHLSAGTSDRPVTEIGISRPELLSEIERTEKLGLRFRLVFVESCHGKMSTELCQRLPKNVELLVSSGDRYLGYESIDYLSLFPKTDDEKRWGDVLDKFLTERFLSVRRETDSTYPFWRWTLIGLVLLGIVVLLVPRRSVG